MLDWAGLGVAGAAVAVATGADLWRRRREGRVRTEPATGEPGGGLLGELGVRPGAPVTLLQFSSAFCAPCRATRVLCGQVAAESPGVHHVEIDAESRLDAVRALGVWRTPTVFVVDGQGRITARITGAPRRDQLREAVRPLLTDEARG